MELGLEPCLKRKEAESAYNRGVTLVDDVRKMLTHFGRDHSINVMCRRQRQSLHMRWVIKIRG